MALKSVTSIKELIEIKERLKEIAKTVEYLAGSIDIIANEIAENKD